LIISKKYQQFSGICPKAAVIIKIYVNLSVAE